MVKLAYLKHADQLVVGNRELQERGILERQQEVGVMLSPLEAVSSAAVVLGPLVTKGQA